MTRHGFGIFTWDRDERVSNRYGAFYLDAVNYNQDVRVSPHLDDLGDLVGQRVMVWCEVVVSRVSGHLGDRALDLQPSRPDVGEIIELGVGILSQVVSPARSDDTIVCPGDRRAIQPRPQRPKRGIFRRRGSG
jgi:hypothetical protein